MAISDVAQSAGSGRGFAARPGLRTALRYGMSTAGPIAVSAAHFIASLIFLRLLPAREFGLFSFVLVMVAFGMSATASLAVVPVTQSLIHGGDRGLCFKVNWLVTAGFGVLLFGALALNGANLPAAGVLGLFGAAFAWRWFARNMAFIDRKNPRAIASDLVYSAVLITALTALALLHRMSLMLGSIALLVSALTALLPFGVEFLRTQTHAWRSASLKDYLPIFRDLSRWSLLGVVLTEITVNAHAYLVTFISGPGAFALLALGMLLMRPASLVQSALPDMERPAMARAIAAKDAKGLARIYRHFSWGLVAALIGTLLLVAGLLAFAPQLLLKKGYSLHDVAVVAAISAAIMGVRTWRTPLAVWLQAAGEFKALAAIGTTSGVISVLATLTLLMAFGPVASLGGIVLGEIVILVRVRALVQDWKMAND